MKGVEIKYRSKDVPGLCNLERLHNRTLWLSGVCPPDAGDGGVCLGVVLVALAILSIKEVT
jgi:hypothetical protein